MKIAITGAAGFTGWHTRCALRARGDVEVSGIDRREWADQDLLDAALAGASAVLHLAGVNRGEASELRAENLALAQRLTATLDRIGSRATVVYANSIQAGNGTAFGEGKLAAGEHLTAWGHSSGAAVVNAHLPNLFGEHGRPYYNSVIATFCHELATGGAPVITSDRELPLLHVQEAVERLIDLALAGQSNDARFETRPMAVSAALSLLTEFRNLYESGEIPPLADPLHLALFNTYRSFTFPAHFPIHPAKRSDNRGDLFECVRAYGGQAQVFCSTTHPDFTRGNHFHLRKIERFIVLRGVGEIALRRLFDKRVLRFKVSGEHPAIIDMPTMWAHSITNIASGELITLFWANEVFDANAADTYPEMVNETPSDTISETNIH